MNFRLIESKQDIEKFEKTFGKGSYNEFQSIKARIPSGTEYVSNVTGIVVDNPKDISDITKTLGVFGDNANQEFSAFIKYYKKLKTKSEEREDAKAGAKLVFKNKETGDRIYHVTTPEAMQFYGRNTTWCIAGKYPGHESEQLDWWKEYAYETENSKHPSYYVLITGDNEKFCFNYDGQHINRVTNAVDETGRGNDNITKEVLKTPYFNPDIYRFFKTEPPTDWSKEVYHWNGEETVPTTVHKVVIPDGVTSIKRGAFIGCISLQSINIPNSVTSIESGAFADCKSLKSITIPDSVTRIEYMAFARCAFLTSIGISNNVTDIGESAFTNCSSLRSVTIPSSVHVIRKNTFKSCGSLRSVNIPDGINQIDDFAFAECRSLQSIVIPDSVTSVGAATFAYCSSLSSIVIPDSISTIETGTFIGCTSLEALTLPSRVTNIEAQAFSNCISLRSITLPSSVKTVDAAAFEGCNALEEITLSKELYKKLLPPTGDTRINFDKVKIKFSDNPTNESLNESYSDQAQKIYSYITNIMKNRQDISNWSYDDYHIEPDWAGSGMRIQVEFDVKPNADSKSICREIMNNIEDYFYGVNCSIGFGRDWECYFTIHVDENACR